MAFCLSKPSQAISTTSYTWKVARLNLVDSISYFFNSIFSSRVARSISERQTFNKFEDEDLAVADQAYSQSAGVLVVSQASDPVDIIWSNMGGARGFYLLRVVLLNLLVLYIILFLSTPAAIYSSLALSQLFDRVNGLVSSLLPPLVIIFINTCLLYLLDFFASWEKRVAHSKYQQSTFTKAFVYLALNMLLIPAATLTVQTTVVSVIKESSMVEALAKFYSGEHLQSQGVFFVSLIVQNACLSVCLNLLRPGELVSAFLSPWLAHYRRKYMNDS